MTEQSGRIAAALRHVLTPSNVSTDRTVEDARAIRKLLGAALEGAAPQPLAPSDWVVTVWIDTPDGSERTPQEMNVSALSERGAKVKAIEALEASGYARDRLHVGLVQAKRPPALPDWSALDTPFAVRLQGISINGGRYRPGQWYGARITDSGVELETGIVVAFSVCAELHARPMEWAEGPLL